MIAASNVADVRDVLDYYNQETNPLDTFKLNQVRIAVSLRFNFFLLIFNYNNNAYK